ncbi:MAG: ABC transporter permease, partial [Saprospiraceae bacterium]
MGTQPPKRALKFLRWFCRPDYLEEIEGNLIEIFEQECEVDPKRANWAFFWQVLWHFRPDFIRPMKPFSLLRGDLLRHHLLISYRGFLRNKSTFLINLVGLTTGLTCVFLIALWVNDELHVDKFLPNDQQLFQVLQTVQGPNGMETIEATPGPLATALQVDLPEVRFATKVIPATFNAGQGVIAVEEKHLKASGKYASRDYFHVFSYPLLQGDPSQVLSQKNGVVISQSLAIRLFESPANAMGRQIDWHSPGVSGPCVVSGVFASIPVNATDHFDLVLSYDWYLDNTPEGGWGDSSPRTYVLLKAGTRPDQFRSKIRDFLTTKDNHISSLLALQRYSERYLYDRFENGIAVGGRIDYIRLFVLIGCFILAIACINFMNLSTAKAGVKVKEVGIKKVVGAARSQLIMQYLTESLLVAITSFLLASGLVAALIPKFNEITGKELPININQVLVLGLLGVALITGLVAGAYPALFLSGHQAIKVLKGKLGISNRELWIRKGLILFQFSVSLLLIVSVIVVSRQIDFIQSGKQLGYDREHVIYFSVDQPGDAMISALENIPEVLSVGGGSLTAGKQLGGTNDVKWAGKPENNQTFFSAFWLSYQLIETLNMKIKEGRSFSESFGSPDQVILNEKAVAQMGL